MAAYLVFIRKETLNKSELETYGAKTPATLEGHDIKILAAYGRQIILEGEDVEGVVIAEFPSVDEAQAWYNSPAYQEVAQHRFRGAVYHGLIVEGL